MTTPKRSLFLACASLCLLVACKSKDAKSDGEAKDAAAKTDEKADTDKEAKTDAKVDAPAGMPAGPKGKDAEGNLEPVVKAAMAAADCKFDENNENLASDCKAFDPLSDALDAAGEPKASAPTLINLLAESSDAVRWLAADELNRGGWQDDTQAVGTVLVAVSTEAHPGVGMALTDALGSVDGKVYQDKSIAAALEAALTKQSKPQTFDGLLRLVDNCEDAEGKCRVLLVNAARQNPDLNNRMLAASDLIRQGDLQGDACAATAEVAVALSEAKPVAEDAEFQPHLDAADLISDLRTTSVDGEKEGETRDCAAELPKLLDAGTAQAKAGTLHPDVFTVLLDIDQREDKDKYMAKLEALAKAVQDNGKLPQESRDTAKDALEGWKG
jgi:major membrane immunogen (membrane-anchored lipoprotein)